MGKGEFHSLDFPLPDKFLAADHIVVFVANKGNPPIIHLRPKAGTFHFGHRFIAHTITVMPVRNPAAKLQKHNRFSMDLLVMRTPP